MENKWETGRVVISRAGHDKGSPMVIYQKISETRVSVIDGKTRTFEKLKMKNINHLQWTTHKIDLKEIEDLKDMGEKNAYIRKQIKQIGY